MYIKHQVLFFAAIGYWLASFGTLAIMRFLLHPNVDNFHLGLEIVMTAGSLGVLRYVALHYKELSSVSFATRIVAIFYILYLGYLWLPQWPQRSSTVNDVGESIIASLVCGVMGLLLFLPSIGRRNEPAKA